MKTPLRLPGLAPLLAAAFIAAVPAAAASDTTVDALTEKDRAQVVSIGGSITEILYALGLQDRIVAVDTTSLYPPEALEENPNVGYMRALSAEGVLATEPGLIVAEPDSGPAEAIGQLKAASVPFLTVPDTPSPEGVLEKIAAVGEIMDREDDAGDLAAKVRADFAALDKETGKIGEPRKVLFILSAQGGRLLVAGKQTGADAIIRLAGAQNAVGDISGYKPISNEALIAAAPDAIVMMSRGDHSASADGILSHPAVAQTPAGKEKRLVVMDGLFLLGFGPRTPQAADALARALYPESGIAPLPERPWSAAETQ